MTFLPPIIQREINHKDNSKLATFCFIMFQYLFFVESPCLNINFVTEYIYKQAELFGPHCVGQVQHKLLKNIN